MFIDVLPLAVLPVIGPLQPEAEFLARHVVFPALLCWLEQSYYGSKYNPKLCIFNYTKM